MQTQDFIFYPYNDMENCDIDIAKQHDSLVNSNRYTAAVSLLEKNNYVRGIRADLLNNMKNKILNLQKYTSSKEITEEDYYLGGIKEYLGNYQYSEILSKEQWKYGNVFYCDFSSVFSSTTPNKGYWMIANEDIIADYRNYSLTLTTEIFTSQSEIYEEDGGYYIKFYCSSPSDETMNFLSQHIGEDIFLISDKVTYTYHLFDYYHSGGSNKMIIQDSYTLRLYSDDKTWISDIAGSEESSFSFYTFEGTSLYPLHYYFPNSVGSNEFIKYLNSYDEYQRITYSDGYYSHIEPTKEQLEDKLFWVKII